MILKHSCNLEMVGAKIRIFPAEVAPHRVDIVLTAKISKCSVNIVFAVE